MRSKITKARLAPWRNTCESSNTALLMSHRALCFISSETPVAPSKEWLKVALPQRLNQTISDGEDRLVGYAFMALSGVDLIVALLQDHSLLVPDTSTIPGGAAMPSRQQGM